MLNAHRFAFPEVFTLGLISKCVSLDKLDETVEEENSELLRRALKAFSSAKHFIAEVRGDEPDVVHNVTI